jgi:hypothetical protein
MPIDVCLTVDTEFDIGGAFANPENCEPVGLNHVLCPVNEQEQGLGFILDTLSEHKQQATFFVETMNTAYFGDRVMGGIVDRLLKEQQDVQLHLHPCWQAFENANWREITVKSPPQDHCANLPPEQLEKLITKGVSLLKKWGVSRVQALRTGNLSAGRNVYQAMHKTGLKLASNIGAGYSLPQEANLQISGGRHRIEGVMEIPVLSYSILKFGSFNKQSMLSITGSSIQEIKQLLMQAAHANVSPVVLITHPFEFVKNHRVEAKRTKNRLNQIKLKELCKFISDNPRLFHMATFGADGDRWLEEGEQAAPEMAASPWPVLKRVIENKFNDKLNFL